MGFPSEIQVLGAAENLSIKEDGAFVRTNGLWHVLIFLRHRACHGDNSQYTFESFDLAQAAFDLNGVTLPISEGSRNVYFEPGATQGNEMQKLFRHREGPRQTYLNRIYTGLVGSGPRQPKLFDASNNALPTTVNLVDEWISILRGLGDNRLVLDTRVHSLITWLFRFGVPSFQGQPAHIAEHSGNGRLDMSSRVLQLPAPTDREGLSIELAKYFGLTPSELGQLLPNLNQVRPNEWIEGAPVSTSILGVNLLSYLNVHETSQNDERHRSDAADEDSAIDDGFDDLVNEFRTIAGRRASFRVEKSLGVRFAAALLSKRFLILTGLAGSGKTKIAQAFARWLSPSTECYAVVPVGADWTGNENVLGYPNGLDMESYISKPALDVILHARDAPEIPHFLILDEMNLSHVERYFSDILSVIESDEEIRLYDGTDRKAGVRPIDNRVELPKNLFIIGTVNVDETTYMFSPKVLDRANVIEFRMDAGELSYFLENPAKPELSNLDGKGCPSFGKAFVDAAKNPVIVPGDVKPVYDAEMLVLFKTLQGHGAEFGYRTAYETARFMHFYKLLGKHADSDDWFPGAFDCVVFQKLLPKLHGSRARLGPVLKKLWYLCVTEHKISGTKQVGDPGFKEERDDLVDAVVKLAEDAARSTDKKTEPVSEIPPGAPYPLSAEKISRMWQLLMDNGFASFAEA